MFKRNRIFVAAISLLILLACDRTEPASDLDAIGFKHLDGRLSIIYADGQDKRVVFWRSCASEPVTKDCETLSKMTPVRIAREIYTRRLVAIQGVTGKFLGYDSLQRYDDEIAAIDKDIDSGELQPDELASAKNHRAEVEANRRRAKVAFDWVTEIAEDGVKSTKDEAYSAAFGKLMAAFKAPAYTRRSLKTPISDPTTGLLWIRFGGNICWYDAMGLVRPQHCTQNTYVNVVPNAGCAAQFGLAWSLPTIGQAFTVASDVPDSITKTWTKTGDYLTYNTVVKEEYAYRFSRINDGWVAMKKPDKSIEREAICVAPASVAQPHGDVDGDGIVNRADKCNRSPGPSMEDVVLEGERLGCAPGQKTDAEYGPTNVEELDADEFTLYVSEEFGRYIEKSGPDEPCTQPSGADGKRHREGKFDPTATRKDGSKGKWLYPPRSHMSECK